MSERAPGVFYASIDIFDPAGQAAIDEGLVYGGETRLFMLTAGSLREALERVLEALTAKQMRLIHVRSAGALGAFEAPCFPFEADLEAMAGDARASGRICATPAYSFAPHDVDWSMVSIGLAEVCDPGLAKARAYTGEYRQFMVLGAPAMALAQLFEACAREGLELKGVDELQDAVLIFGDDPFGKGTVSEALEKVSEELTWGTSYEYETAGEA